MSVSRTELVPRDEEKLRTLWTLFDLKSGR
jgi:hypothetical protein